MKKETITKILGILFIIWFIASIIAIIFAASKNTNLAIILVGQYFMIFGIVGISSAKAPMIAIHYFTGLALLTAGLISINYNKLSILATDLSLNQIIFIALLIISLISIIVTLILFLRDSKTNKYLYPFIVSNIIYIIGIIIMAFY